MTEIDPSLIYKGEDFIYYYGEKYQKVEPPKSFYDKLWEELGKKVGYGIDCDQLTDRVMDLIKDNIPEPLDNKYYSDIIQGYNTALKDVRKRF
jgi:hypothetical protein